MKVQHLNEEALIKACSQNDRLAQKRLYECHYNKMMGICMRYASTPEDAVEILNNGFYKVFTKINQFDPKRGQLSSWISGIMVKTSIDHFRKNKKHQHSLPIEEELLGESNSVPLDNLTGEELLSYIQKLSPVYRMVFNLFVMEGKNHKEIADQLGITVGSSKSNLSKAKSRLRVMIVEADNYILNKEAQ